MPAILTLSGQKYGLLTARRPTGSSRRGQRLWQCVCECGNKTTVGASDLKNGHVRSCGCLRTVHRPLKPATTKRIVKALEAGDVFKDERGEFYSPRKAAKYLGVSDVTLTKYQDVGGGRCPWRDGGRPILTTPVKTSFRKESRYSFKPHLDDVRAAMVERAARRETPGFATVDGLADELGWYPQSIRRIYRKWCKRLKRRAVYIHLGAKDVLGRATKYSCVPEDFARWLRSRPAGVYHWVAKTLKDASMHDVPEARENPAKESKSAVREGRAGSESPDESQAIKPFSPSVLQKAILHALINNALTGDALETLLHVDRRRLYYGGTPDGSGGLNELCEVGRVKAGKGRYSRGYYRPDFPPS